MGGVECGGKQAAGTAAAGQQRQDSSSSRNSRVAVSTAGGLQHTTTSRLPQLPNPSMQPPPFRQYNYHHRPTHPRVCRARRSPQWAPRQRCHLHPPGSPSSASTSGCVCLRVFVCVFLGGGGRRSRAQHDTAQCGVSELSRAGLSWPTGRQTCRHAHTQDKGSQHTALAHCSALRTCTPHSCTHTRAHTHTCCCHPPAALAGLVGVCHSLDNQALSGRGNSLIQERLERGGVTPTAAAAAVRSRAGGSHAALRSVTA